MACALPPPCFLTDLPAPFLVTHLSEFVSLAIVKKESNNKTQEPVKEEEEANPVPESPVPGLPPRSHGTGVSV